MFLHFPPTTKGRWTRYDLSRTSVGFSSPHRVLPFGLWKFLVKRSSINHSRDNECVQFDVRLINLTYYVSYYQNIEIVVGIGRVQPYVKPNKLLTEFTNEPVPFVLRSQKLEDVCKTSQYCQGKEDNGVGLCRKAERTVRRNKVILILKLLTTGVQPKRTSRLRITQSSV